ncbi:hypothetical protein DENSPDRAFT_229102 [Dentipellis sp. KUC8613]|nr:hypothetical protein DENSPDRAFT_229102 [Dentipellis sp. KUC8613]
MLGRAKGERIRRATTTSCTRVSEGLQEARRHDDGRKRTCWSVGGLGSACLATSLDCVHLVVLASLTPCLPLLHSAAIRLQQCSTVECLRQLNLFTCIARSCFLERISRVRSQTISAERQSRPDIDTYPEDATVRGYSSRFNSLRGLMRAVSCIRGYSYERMNYTHVFLKTGYLVPLQLGHRSACCELHTRVTPVALKIQVLTYLLSHGWPSCPFSLHDPVISMWKFS